MGCASSRVGEPRRAELRSHAQRRAAVLDPDSTEALAAETNFNESEVEALRELYRKLSNELHRDNLIHKDEFAWALFKATRDSLFIDRLFALFDIKQNDVIEFGEFVRSLSIFHPKASLEDKARFAFRIYDIDGSGSIEPPELKRFLVAVMVENPDLELDEAALDEVVEETFAEIDLARDGRINPEEWMALVHRNPSVIGFMTLPTLTELARRLPAPPAHPGQKL